MTAAVKGRTLYVTTPIYYVNDVPHPGHAYTTIAADTLTRARRLQGHDVFFLTGTDEHGQNIERIAREKGIPAQQYCDGVAAAFARLWEKLQIRYDRFIRTTDELHKRGVLALWERLREATTPDGRAAVYRDKYAGWYCPRCEAFYTEEELKPPDHLCPDHDRPCEWTEEENFFFRLSAYSAWLNAEIDSRRLLIEPVGRRNEVLSVIGQGLKDFSISRARVKWGIPVPQEPGHVFYVWMDALANYITALGFGEEGAARRDFEKYWQHADERMHFVGKEIIRFHCLYWPAMLRAAALPIPTRVFAHGWLTKNGKKLSKTTGNTIDPDELISRCGPDAFRYFFLREGSFGQDWDFTDVAFSGRYNADLANDLGNLVSRALTMVARYREGRVPSKPAVPLVATTDFEALFQLDAARYPHVQKALSSYEALDFAGALAEVWSWIGRLNQRIVEVAPWQLAKDATRAAELDAFLYRLLEAIRFVAVLVEPVMPDSARRILAMLGLGAHDPRPADLDWGLLEAGSPLGDIAALFPRLEAAAAGSPTAQRTITITGYGPTAKKEKTVSEATPPSPPTAQTPASTAADKIDIADFAKVDLRVAQIKSAERVAGSKKLIKLQVDLGETTRQVVAGIAEAYAPESLVGKKIVLVANLRPAKLMGVESDGMVLAASLEGKAVLCTFDGDVPPGTKVK